MKFFILFFYDHVFRQCAATHAGGAGHCPCENCPWIIECYGDGCVSTNEIRYGNDLAFTGHYIETKSGVETVQNCMDHCLANSNCKAFTYFTDQNCWLRSQAEGPSDASGTVLSKSRFWVGILP